MIQEAISKVIERQDLSEVEAVTAMEAIMNGDATPAQIACYITALRMKGETVEEITGSVRVMRAKATRIPTKHALLVDTCGTGGDGSHTFNISTIAAFIVAGAGVPVAKHGNRSVSSKCGSADVLRELGVNVEASVETVSRCIDDVGIGFMFAPLLHSAMKYAIGPRREIGIRTIFNALGPLTNPAGAQAQVLGVYTAELVEPLAHVLQRLGSTMACVVHGDDGLDEITTTTTTHVSLLYDGAVTNDVIDPQDFGIELARPEDLKGGDAEENAAIALNVLGGDTGPKRDIVLLNAAAALVVGGKAADMEQGISLAAATLDSGAALQKLEELKAMSHS